MIEFDANFNRTDESFMQNQYMGKNLKDLQTSIDSMGVRLDSIKDVNAKSIYDASYVKTLKSLRAKKESEAEGQPDEQQEKLPVITPTIKLDFDSLYTLEEALMTCKDRILVNIDKGGTYIKEILPIIRKCGMEKQVIIKGRYPVEKVQEALFE